MEWFEHDQYFCTNPQCALHVRAGDEGVQGAGNWAQLDNGCIIGRGRYGSRMLCDLCGKQELLHIAVEQAAPATEAAHAVAPSKSAS